MGVHLIFPPRFIHRPRAQVRAPASDAGMVARVFTNGGGLAGGVSPGGVSGREDAESTTPQRKGPRIKYVCRKAAIAQGM